MLRIGLLILFSVLFSCSRYSFRESSAATQSSFDAAQFPVLQKDTLIGKRNIHYLVTGDSAKPALVFMHGSPGSWSAFKNYLLDSALQQKFQLIAFDRPGFGYSNYRKPMRLAAQCSLIMPIILQYKQGKPLFLVGHSLGGPAVIQLAAIAPDSVQAIVVLSGSISPEHEKAEIWRHIVRYTPFRYAFPGAFRQSNTELSMFKTGVKKLVPEFQKVKAHVKFMHGDLDKWVPIGNAVFGKKMLVNAASVSIDTLKNANHFIPWMHAAEIKSVLLSLY